MAWFGAMVARENDGGGWSRQPCNVRVEMYED